MFTLHTIVYRLSLGVVVLAVVIPVWASGHKPMWPVAISTILVVTIGGVVLARQTRLGDWLRHR
jgi:hypothetical protein